MWVWSEQIKDYSKYTWSIRRINRVFGRNSHVSKVKLIIEKFEDWIANFETCINDFGMMST